MLPPGSPLVLLDVLGSPAAFSAAAPGAETRSAASDARSVADGRLAVLFDRDCGVCQETVRTLRRWDHGRRLEFVPLQDAEDSGEPFLVRIARERPLDEEVHVVDLDTGAVTAGGQAALAILDVLPGGWLLRPWAALPPTALAADVLYRFASRHRDTVGWMVGLRDDVACPFGPGPDTLQEG